MRQSAGRQKMARLLTQPEFQPFVDQWSDHLPLDMRLSGHHMVPVQTLSDFMEEEGDPRHELIQSRANSIIRGDGEFDHQEHDLGLDPGSRWEASTRETPFFHVSNGFADGGVYYSVTSHNHDGTPFFQISTTTPTSSGGPPLVASKHFWHNDAHDFADRLALHNPEVGERLHAAIDEGHGQFLNHLHAQAGEHQAHAMKRTGKKRKNAKVEPTDMHPDYQPTGIAPRIGHALSRIAAESDDAHHGPNHAALAEAILRTGDHSVLPILADALEENSHPLYHEFDWRHAPRAIEVDRALHHTVESLPPVRHFDGNLMPATPGWIFADWKGGTRGRLTRKRAMQVAKKVSHDATRSDVIHSLQRLIAHRWLRQGTGLVSELPSERAAHTRVIEDEDAKLLGALPVNPHRYPDTRPQPKTRKSKKNSREGNPVKCGMRAFAEYKPFLGHIENLADGGYVADREAKTGPAPDLILADFLDEADDPRGDLIRASVLRSGGGQRHVSTSIGKTLVNAHLGQPVKSDSWLTTYKPHRMADGSRLEAAHFTPTEGSMQGVPHIHMDWYHPDYQHAVHYSGYLTVPETHDFADRIEGYDPHTAKAVRDMLNEGDRVHLSNSAMGKVPPVLPSKFARDNEDDIATNPDNVQQVETPANKKWDGVIPPATTTSKSMVGGNKAGQFRTPEERIAHLTAVSKTLAQRRDHRAPIAAAQLDRATLKSPKWAKLDQAVKDNAVGVESHAFGTHANGTKGKVDFHLYHGPTGMPMVYVRHTDGFGTMAAHLKPSQASEVARLMPANTPAEKEMADSVAAKVAEHAYSRPAKMSRKGTPKKMKAEVKSGLAQAISRLHSGTEKAFRETLADVLNRTNLKPHKIHQVLHDTPNNVKPSVAASILRKVRDDQSEYAAAYHGLLTNQPAVLLFKSHNDGQDSVYRLKINQKPEQIRTTLDKLGFNSRLLIPRQGHTEVVLHDPQRKRRGKVAGLAGKLNVGVEEVVGTGTILGGRDAEAARAKYRDVVRSFENGGKAKMSRVKYSRENHESFHRSMIDHPNDITSDLVYADYLDDTSKPFLADLIRSSARDGRKQFWIGRSTVPYGFPHHLETPDDYQRKDGFFTHQVVLNHPDLNYSITHSRLYSSNDRDEEKKSSVLIEKELMDLFREMKK